MKTRWIRLAGLMLVIGAAGCVDDASNGDGDGSLLPRDTQPPGDGAADAGPDIGGGPNDFQPTDGPGDAVVDVAGDAAVDAAADIALDGPADASLDGQTEDVPDMARDEGIDGPEIDGADPDAGDVGEAPDAGPGPACGTPVQGEPQCPALCGNNQRDQCPGGRLGRPPPPFDAGPPPPVTEQCDGDDLAGMTCERLGFVGGDLACGPNCLNDLRSCDFCRDDPRLVACRRASRDRVQPAHLALATTDVAALAWVAITEEDGATLFFETFEGADLTPADFSCLGQGGAGGVALAGTDEGYLVATVGPGEGLRVRSLDRAGGVTGDGFAVAGGRRIMLEAMAAGTLMVWTAEDGAVSASLLDDQGDELWRTRVFNSEIGRASAIEVADGYLVAQRTAVDLPGGGRHNGVAVARLSAAGMLQGVTTPVPPSTEYPSLATNGQQVRLTYADFGQQPELHWVSLDANGEALARAQLGDRPRFNPAPILMFGDHTLALIGAYTGRTDHADHLSIARFDAQGAPVGPEFIVNEDPNYSGFWQLDRVGDDMVLAWIESGHGIGLARFRP